ncbi:MAG: dTMP kinase [Verrucomicrobiae bacterium]|nr:dTMP kinase [Verrucomicrobiae bacterium]
MKRGVFISFEGSEGCGKSTQIARLERRLAHVGIEVLRTREPGGTAAGERIRDLLQHAPEGENLMPEAELLLFAASRAQLVREVIAPALDRGAWVIADRFLDSTTVYQGVGRGLDREAVAAINGFAVGEWLPDLTFLLDMDATRGHARAVAARGELPDRMEDQPLEFFEAVRTGYLELAKENPDRIRIIDASDGVDRIEQRLWIACRRKFDEFFR